MNSVILKFLNKKCKVDSKLLNELKHKGYLTRKFYKYIVLNTGDAGMEEIWVSEKDDKFLIEFRNITSSINYERKRICKERDNYLNCEKEYNDIMEELKKYEAMPETIPEGRMDEIQKEIDELKKKFEDVVERNKKTINIYDIVDEKDVLRSNTFSSKKELFKFLSENTKSFY